ncbi:MAG: hypothetical protein GC202_14440 [Alphaproteobacteria bacterium]|nr:hypothetical protein [Alphaproteobacteria bacterium]
MVDPARAADPADDAGRTALRTRLADAGYSGIGERFTRLLEARLSQPSASGPSNRRIAADGIQVFVADRTPPHLLAWHAARARRTHFADSVPLAGPHARAAWHAALVPDPAALAVPTQRTGLAVFDGDGLLARLEFVWVRGPSGWQLDREPDIDTESVRKDVTPSPIDVEAVPATLHGMWPASCGRCRRYRLGRGVGSPSLALCRRDCLPTIGPF